MKILVTGGAGFIASHIVDKYIELGHKVVVIDNLSSGKQESIHPKAKFYQADIKDTAKIKEIFVLERPEILNHHAAQMSVRLSVDDPIFDAEVNIIGLLNLLEAGRQNGLKKIIFASSGGVVYGEANVLPTAENYEPKEPLSPYGVSKFASENYLYFYHKNYHIPYIALRYANVYGPRQNPHGEAGVVAIFSLKLLKGERPVVNGDGLQTRDYVYIADVCQANINALENAKTGPFNIGTSRETNVNELFEKLAKVSHTHLSAIHGPPKKGEQKRSALDISRARKWLSWEPKISLSEGLKLTYESFKNFQKT